MQKNALFWLPRISSIVVGYIAFAFLTESIISTTGVMSLVASIFGILATAAVVFFWKRLKKEKILVLLPLGFWFGLFMYFILGGFAQNLNLIRFVFLSTLAGTLTGLAYYTWAHQLVGGILYIGLGLFYLLIAFGNVSFFAILIITGFLAQTGGTFLFEHIKAQSLSKNKDDQPENRK